MRLRALLARVFSKALPSLKAQPRVMSFSWEPLEIELIGDNFAHPGAVPTITVSFLGSMRMLVVGVWEVGMLVPQSYMRV
jgi:hypothetical protein